MKQKNDEVRIDKIVISLPGEKISLSTENAKRLYEELHKLFGDRETIIWRDRHWWLNPPYPYVYTSDKAAVPTDVTITSNTLMINAG